jgi:hypothetical protein
MSAVVIGEESRKRAPIALPRQAKPIAPFEMIPSPTECA